MNRFTVSAMALSTGLFAAACMDNAADKTTVTNSDGTKTTVAANRDGTTTTSTTARDGTTSTTAVAPVVNRDGTTATAANGTAYDVDGKAAVVPTKTEGDVAAMAMLTALNQGEVDQANAAIPKLAHKEAKYFATMMLRHHSEGITKLSGIAAEQHMTMTETSASRSMKTDNADLVGKLSTMTAGPAFDRAYMQAQVDGHTKALKMIDSDILPKIDNAALKTVVTDMRVQVADHLAKARDIVPTIPAT